jgi:hypothetical protein
MQFALETVIVWVAVPALIAGLALAVGVGDCLRRRRLTCPTCGHVADDREVAGGVCWVCGGYL